VMWKRPRPFSPGRVTERTGEIGWLSRYGRHEYKRHDGAKDGTE